MSRLSIKWSSGDLTILEHNQFQNFWSTPLISWPITQLNDESKFKVFVTSSFLSFELYLKVPYWFSRLIAAGIADKDALLCLIVYLMVRTLPFWLRLPNFILTREYGGDGMLKYKTQLDNPLSISFQISQTNAILVVTLGSHLFCWEPIAQCPIFGWYHHTIQLHIFIIASVR